MAGALPHPPLNRYTHIQERNSSVAALSADKYMPCQECFILLLSLSFPISSLAAPRDCTGANVDGQQGWAVAILACDGAEPSW